MIFNSPKNVLIIDAESEIHSSLVQISCKQLLLNGIVKAAITLESKEIKESQLICGIIGSSHSSLGFFGSAVYYTNCLENFFRIQDGSSNIKETTSFGQPAFFYRLNQYNDQVIYSTAGGVVIIKARDSLKIRGKVDVSGENGGSSNDIIFGATSGGSISLESLQMEIEGRTKAF